MVYNRILVPLDGSEHGSQAIPYARILGKSLGAKVELFRVFDPQPEFFWPNPSEYLQRHQAALEFRQQVMVDLESISSSLQEDGVDAIALFHGPEGVHPRATSMAINTAPRPNTSCSRREAIRTPLS